MSERRRALVRLEIARAAVDLFTVKGVAATTGDDIARAVGVSTRTLWRYFPGKEACVRPLLTTGLDHIAALLRSCPDGVPLLDHLERAGLFDHDVPHAVEPVAHLIRMTRTEPGLMAVWLEVHHAAEGVFAEILATRTGAPPGDLAVRVQAAALNVALRLAAEEQARLVAEGDRPPAGGLGALMRTALTAAARGLPAFGGGAAGGPPGPGGPPAA
ncbi:TetR/AcrR family transcriptional regulator [Nocardiopsis trehalosi]|jgi:AcrR family transcriptional regulator|uniref:TetR/AcrR family transcriptional regulator n=1 Tax=Nocardiopsis trehalosi TaxID=109329 RepID=UPI000834325B|nr:TetR/AcrR family transcriptional regulator [Nocardiopsis trehalosi]